MDVSNPISSVITSAHGPVLSVLAGASEPLTGRTVASLTEPPVSRSQTAAVLAHLTASGLVHVIDAGSARLYTLNRAHLAAPAVEQLANLRSRLWNRIAEHASTWVHRPDALAVYGSTARGDGHMGSDIDILVIRPDGVDSSDPAWSDSLNAFAHAVVSWTGNDVELLDRSHDELAEMAATGELLLDDIRRDGRFLIGARSMVPAPLAA
ncbi:nucleotidyltransferase domain-containing protein [Cellulomonas palmilytica]|uniref:nucleotidyltransferase domain-containing protein n=1 Tax=Cellulomonas palmilytica TaxID=2608402 RepID=UPI001F381C3E|nr:nucleotidyltransferase domain-containing protein [Cellulomonas palmilytica]UJP40592.1 nucleotidyltransferase domain-containing protein [Cellulomonas palmilytica]